MIEDINVLRELNVLKVMKDGPRLRSDYNTWIVARDPEAGLIKLGGLGGMGVGEMWFQESERDVQLPGYEDAPTVQSPAQSDDPFWRLR